MKSKKALLSVLATGVLLSLGLAACGAPSNGGSTSKGQSQQSSEVEEEKIVVTAAGDKKELQAGETVQLSANVQGVTWSTKNEDIVSVSADGLVTALKEGAARVTAKKDGYANGNITITVVRAPERAAKYELRLEDAEHYSPEDYWGYKQWGIGPGDSPVEDNGGKTDDGTSLGYLTAGCKETLKFTSNKAAKVEIGVSMAFNAVVQLQSVMTVKFNGQEISMAGIETVAPDEEGAYYEFHGISFGMVDLKAGENVLVLEMIGQAPNLDKVLIWTEENLEVKTIPAPKKEPIVVKETAVVLEVEKTAQIESETTGLTYVSANPEIATVSGTGLITGVARGKTTITVSKEGMKDATVEVTVKAKPVAGTVVIEAEEGELSEGAKVETNNADASGTGHVGYLSEGTSLTLKYTAAQTAKVKATLRAASAVVKDWSTYPNVTAEPMVLTETMTLKVNGKDVDLTGKTLPGGPFGTWVEVELGELDLVAGENTFLFEFISQGPNIDCLTLAGVGGSNDVGGTIKDGDTYPSYDVDLSTAFYSEAEDADLAGGARTENKETAHGGKSVGYMGADASITFKVNASDAGKAQMVLLAGTTADWSNWQNPVYQDCDLDETMTMTLNGTNINLAGRGTNASIGAAFAPIDFGEVDLVKGVNTIVITATVQTINVDALAFIGKGITVGEVPPAADPEGMIALEFETAEFERPEGKDETNAFVTEANKKCHGGASLGYVVEGGKITLKFNASAAGKVDMSFVAASAKGEFSFQTWSTVIVEQALADCMTMTLNDANVDLTGKVLPGNAEGSYTNFQEVSFGKVDVKAGLNTIVLEFTAAGPNLDCIKLQGDSAVTVSYVK